MYKNIAGSFIYNRLKIEATEIPNNWRTDILWYISIMEHSLAIWNKTWHMQNIENLRYYVDEENRNNNYL